MNLKLYFFVTVSLLFSLSIMSQDIIVDSRLDNKLLVSKPDDVNSMQKLVLENGLTIYLNEDHTQKNVLGAVIIRGGAKLDPADATGTAHYFEHLMFKGSQKLGTIDYKHERPYLDSISQLYELLRLDRKNEEFRKAILKKIDSFSVVASQYAIPNEFSKVMSSIGGTGVNAYTTYENIVYHNSFPPQSINQWIELYVDRFESPVFRLFQSELETVYEEKNRAMDNSFRKIFEEVYSNFYPNSAYGKRTVLGSIEDLKNPSIRAIETYWKEYYNAKNMALVLIGNFNMHEVIPMLKQRFGTWRQGEKARMPSAKEKPFNGRVKVKTKLAPIPIGILGFRSVAKGHDDELALSIISKILTNDDETGLVDTLSKSGKLLGAQVFIDEHYDKGGFFVFFVPKPIIQSINNGEKKVIAQIQKLKEGKFNDELFKAVKVSMRKNYEHSHESSYFKLSKTVDVFMTEKEWESIEEYNKKLDLITKAEIVKIANKYLGDNYLAFYSKIGFPKKHKLDKPINTPLDPENKDKKSEMANKISLMDISEIEPDFLDFEKDISISNINGNLHYYCVQNPVNNIFSLNIRIGIGTYELPKLQQLAFYLNNAGTDKMSSSEFKQKLQLQGISIYFGVSKDYFSIYLDGFDRSFNNAINDLNDLLSNFKEDKSLSKKMVREYKMELKGMKKDISSKMYIMQEYALFGKQSTYLHRLKKSEIKKMDYQEMKKLLKEVFAYETFVHYVGNNDEENVKLLVANTLPFAKTLRRSNSPLVRDLATSNANKVIFLRDKKAIQTHIRVTIPSNNLDQEGRVLLNPFNYYFGLGMNSLMFREVREYRSLAYGAWAYYSVPYRFDKAGYFVAAMSTQADKTNEAMDLLYSLLDSMPVQNGQLPALRSYLLRSINSKMPSFRYRSYNVQYWMRQGYNSDPRQFSYQKYKKLEMEDIIKFYNANILGRSQCVSIVGDSKRFDLVKVAKGRELKKVKLKDILRY